jgi:iron(III) transport system ATP-binding protein
MAILDHGEVLQVGAPRDVYRRPRTKTVADFIGETDFIPGKLVSADASGGASVQTEIGRFEGVLGDPASHPVPGAAVTLSVRPECWILGREPASTNAVRGKIGAAVYLGELAQYDLIAGNHELKILELNPRFLDQATRGEVFASVAAEDVVVLTE